MRKGNTLLAYASLPEMPKILTKRQMMQKERICAKRQKQIGICLECDKKHCNGTCTKFPERH